jgi:hypothetical protein
VTSSMNPLIFDEPAATGRVPMKSTQGGRLLPRSLARRTLPFEQAGQRKAHTMIELMVYTGD